MSDEQTPIQGLTVDDGEPERLHEALEMAFNYRGDVTIRCRSLPEPVEGFVYDRVAADGPGEPRLRIMPADGSPRLTIPYEDVAEIRFSGRDTAAGKSFESWMRNYVRKKLAGEEATIESEPLD
ncbi:MAG: hypothetical protein ACYSTY_10365 [Planctomycetota bacterium]|jgi:hypothetical protein